MIQLDKSTPIADIVKILKMYLKHDFKNRFLKNQKCFSVNVNNIFKYTDYEGQIASWEKGEFTGFNRKNCHKDSAFWKAMFTLEKDMSKKYDLNFDQIRFSFWYSGNIVITRKNKL